MLRVVPDLKDAYFTAMAGHNGGLPWGTGRRGSRLVRLGEIARSEMVADRAASHLLTAVR